MEEGLVVSPVVTAEDDAVAAAGERDWEELEGEGGGLRFVFPAASRFPPVPRFVGGKRDFPSGEQARINEIQANTFAAFVNICPDFKTITAAVPAAGGRKTHRRSGSSATNDDTLRRRGGSGGATSLTMAPTPSSSDSADYASVAEEQKRESRYVRLDLAQASSVVLTSMPHQEDAAVQGEEEEHEHGAAEVGGQGVNSRV
jgi:hypothetical protein